MATVLQQQGLMTSGEWSSALGAAIERARLAGDPVDGSTYYEHVLTALETVLNGKGVADLAELRARRDAWARAYSATPHGQPVEIDRFR